MAYFEHKKKGFGYFRFQRNNESRVFRVNYDTLEVVQVIESLSTILRRGRTNNIGIYFITITTLFTNYGFKGLYLNEISKSDYDKSFFSVMKKLHEGKQ